MSCGNKDIFPLRTGVREGTYSLAQMDPYTGVPLSKPTISGRQARLRRNNSCLRCGPICNKNSCPKCINPGGKQVFKESVNFPRIPKIQSDIGTTQFIGNTSTTSVTVWSSTQ